MEVATLALVASATALGTGLGAVPVFYSALERSSCAHFCGALRRARGAWLRSWGCWCRRLTREARPQLGRGWRPVWCSCSAHAVSYRAATSMWASCVAPGSPARCSSSVHRLPEGFAIGTPHRGWPCSSFWRSACRTSRRARAWRSRWTGAGFTRAQQFWAAVLTRCATAPRRRRGLPGRRAGQWAASLFVRVRSGNDALARHGRTLTPGLSGAAGELRPRAPRRGRQ